jgi:hypothetical protein
MEFRRIVDSLGPKRRIMLDQFRTVYINGHPTMVSQGPLEAIEKLITRSEFESLFGGYVIHVDKRGKKYLGVWSVRLCSRFRRILRERGAEIVVREIDGTGMSISIVHQSGPTGQSFRVSPLT